MVDAFTNGLPSLSPLCPAADGGGRWAVGGRAPHKRCSERRHPAIRRRLGPTFGTGKAGHDHLPVRLAVQQAGIPARHFAGPGAAGCHPGWNRRFDLS